MAVKISKDGVSKEVPLSRFINRVEELGWEKVEPLNPTFEYPDGEKVKITKPWLDKEIKSSVAFSQMYPNAEYNESSIDTGITSPSTGGEKFYTFSDLMGGVSSTLRPDVKEMAKGYYGGDIEELWKNREKVKAGYKKDRGKYRKALGLVQALEAMQGQEDGLVRQPVELYNNDLELEAGVTPEAANYYERMFNTQAYRREVGGGGISNKELMFPEATRRSKPDDSNLLSVGIGALKDVVRAPGRFARAGIEDLAGVDDLTFKERAAMPDRYKSGGQEFFDEVTSLTGLGGLPFKALGATRPVQAVGGMAYRGLSKVPGGSKLQGMFRSPEAIIYDKPVSGAQRFGRSVVKGAPETAIDAGYEATRLEDENPMGAGGIAATSLAGLGLAGLSGAKLGSAGDAISRKLNLPDRPPVRADLYDQLRRKQFMYDMPGLEPYEQVDLASSIVDEGIGKESTRLDEALGIGQPQSTSRFVDVPSERGNLAYEVAGKPTIRSFDIKDLYKGMDSDERKYIEELFPDAQGSNLTPKEYRSLRTEMGSRIANTSNPDKKAAIKKAFKNLASEFDAKVSSSIESVESGLSRNVDEISDPAFDEVRSISKEMDKVKLSNLNTIKDSYAKMSSMYRTKENLIKADITSLSDAKKVDSFLNSIANIRGNQHIKSTAWRTLTDDMGKIRDLADTPELKKKADYITRAIMQKVQEKGFLDALFEGNQDLSARALDLIQRYGKAAITDGHLSNLVRESVGTDRPGTGGRDLVPGVEYDIPLEGEGKSLRSLSGT